MPDCGIRLRNDRVYRTNSDLFWRSLTILSRNTKASVVMRGHTENFSDARGLGLCSSSQYHWMFLYSVYMMSLSLSLYRCFHNQQILGICFHSYINCKPCNDLAETFHHHFREIFFGGNLQPWWPRTNGNKSWGSVKTRIFVSWMLDILLFGPLPFEKQQQKPVFFVEAKMPSFVA